MLSKEEIENIHWSTKEKSIVFDHREQKHHYDLSNIKKMILCTWDIQGRFDEVIEKLEKEKYTTESTYSQINGNYLVAQDKLDLINEVLKILKGENK